MRVFDRSFIGPGRLARLLLCCVLWAPPIAADVAIVTSTGTPLEELEEARARALWLGETERVKGVRLAVADRSDVEIREEFYRLVLGKTRGQLKAIRAKRAFQYGVAPPPEFPSDESVLTWVRSRDNRLGYVDAGAVTDPAAAGVKVLLIIEAPERSEPP